MEDVVPLNRLLVSHEIHNAMRQVPLVIHAYQIEGVAFVQATRLVPPLALTTGSLVLQPTWVLVR